MVHICTRILRRKAVGNAIRARRGQDYSAAGASQEVPQDTTIVATILLLLHTRSSVDYPRSRLQ